MEDISFKLDLALSSLLSKVSTSTVSNGDTSTIYYDSVPFAPINSATEQKIKMMKPGEEKELVFEIMVYPDAEARVYKVPIVLDYRDELERNYTKEDIVGLVVGSKSAPYPNASTAMVYCLIMPGWSFSACFTT